VATTGIILLLLSGVLPSILVVPSTPAARPVCEDLVEGFSAQTVGVKLAGDKSDAVGCMAQEGPERARCLADAVAQAKVDGLVLVSATARGPQTAVTLQLMSRQGEPQRQETVRAPKTRVAHYARSAIGRTMSALRALLAREQAQEQEAPARAEALAAPPAPTVTPPARTRDAPVATRRLEPPAPPEERELALPAPPPAVIERSRLPGWIAASVAVAGAGVAATFTGLALSNTSRLNSTIEGLSPLSYSQAAQLRDQTNIEFTVALSAGITVLVAGSIAGALWVK